MHQFFLILLKYINIYDILNWKIYKTAIDYAKEKGNQEIVDILSKAETEPNIPGNNKALQSKIKQLEKENIELEQKLSLIEHENDDLKKKLAQIELENIE